MSASTGNFRKQSLATPAKERAPEERSFGAFSILGRWYHELEIKYAQELLVMASGAGYAKHETWSSKPLLSVKRDPVASGSEAAESPLSGTTG